MADGEERVSPWHWPRLWVRDEKFWRDVASRVASGLIVAGVVYVLGVAGGYFKRPNVLPFVLGAVGLAGWMVWQWNAQRWSPMRQRLPRWLFEVLDWGIGLVSWGLVVWAVLGRH